MPYLNYLGNPMPESAAPVRNLYGTGAANETLTAPAGPSSVDSNGGVGDVLIGSSGDNIFYIKHPSEIVRVDPGLSGIKTVVAFTSFTLPANVQNLTSSGAFNYAVGNSLDNLIIVGNDAETLYGGGGNDVLVAGAGADTFMVKAGEGNDVIYGWTAKDQVQLIGTAFKSFAEVTAAMRQVGSDVVLQLDPTETLTFRGVTPAAFTAQQLLLPLDRTKLGALTFDDEFNSFQKYDFSTNTGLWQTNFGYDPHNPGNYSLLQNGEQQRYLTGSFQGAADHPLGYEPFSAAGGVLTITASPIAAADQAAAYGGGYASGMIDTRGIFEQKYGYFEIRMAIPTGATGAWPAFWLTPDPNSSGIEADVTENTAIQSNIDFVRGYGGAGNAAAFSNVLKTGDLTGFHTYGLLWTPQTLTFYYDDQAVFTAPTPSTWTDPMYLIANLAIGGFGGNPDPAKFPAQMQIDYIHAYGLPDGTSVVQHLTPLAPGGTLRVNGQVIAGEPALVSPTFADDGTAVTTRRVVHLSADPAHVPPSELAAAGTKAFLIWDQGGAIQGAYKSGSTISSSVTLAVGTIAGTQMGGGFLTDGKALLTWTQSDGGLPHVWAELVDPASLALARQQLGPGSGGVSFTATAHGGYAAAWTNGAETDARGYDGYGYYGEVIKTQGPIAGTTAAGDVVAAWTDPQGQHSQLYDVLQDPFNNHQTTQSVSALDQAFAAILRRPVQTPSDTSRVGGLAQQVDAGAMTLANAVLALAHDGGATSSVATLAYEFFTGSAPTAAGMDFLVSPSGPNPNNLNSAYYQLFNLENRYINFAVNLGKGGAGAAGFAAAYGGLSLHDATSKAYATIFGTTPTETKLGALLDASVTVGGQNMTRADYFAIYGADGASGVGTKAAMAGWLLAEAEKANVGSYALSNDAFLQDVGLHNAPFGVDIIGHYNQPGFAYTGG